MLRWPWLACVAAVDEHWTVIVDAGSTGSRLYAYQTGADSAWSGGVRVHRGNKVRPGLAMFANATHEAVAQLAALFNDGRDLVPASQRKSTRALIQCTGGVRDELSATESQGLLAAIFQGLSSLASFPFALASRDVATVSGDDEAFYAFAAANFLDRRVDHALRVVDAAGLLGALDLGGSSTQITYAMPTRCAGDVCAPATIASTDDNLVAKSFAGLGAQSVQDRVRSTLQSVDPCAHVGFATDLLQGGGDFEACVAAIRAVLCERRNATRTVCSIDGAPVASPPPRTKFLAMCNFFYAADAVRALAPPHAPPLPDWPMPDLDALARVAAAFCAVPWDTVNATMHGRHAYTPPHLLHSRCFDAAYVLVLLRDVYALDDHPRVIFALDAQTGADVDWTLGFFLSEVVAPHATTSTDSSASSSAEITSSIF